MQTINRTNKPATVTNNKKVYEYVTSTSRRTAHREWKYILDFLHERKYLIIQVNVLARQLKGKKDLHDREYEANQFIYSYPKISDEHRKELEEWQAKPWKHWQPVSTIEALEAALKQHYPGYTEKTETENLTIFHNTTGELVGQWHHGNRSGLILN